MRKAHIWGVSALLPTLLLACDHSLPYVVAPTERNGPADTGEPLRLTFNPESDYWPMLTEDGQGIVYSYVVPSRADHDRCIGILPLAGGTRLWSMCDDRATHADSADSFPAYAVGDDGRLLYVQVIAGFPLERVPRKKVLWLADTAAPFERRALINFPIFVGDSSVDWMADLQWTGPKQFIGLAQRFMMGQHCVNCLADDSLFYGQHVVTGTITDAGATLTPIAGTAGAQMYAMAENNATVVFVHGRSESNRTLWRVGASGGTPVAAVSIPSGGTILGVTCRFELCVVATGSIILRPGFQLLGCNSTDRNPSGRLWLVNIRTGLVFSGGFASPNVIYATPLYAPNGEDVIVQVGGMHGHLQTYASSFVCPSFSDLLLFRGAGRP